MISAPVRLSVVVPFHRDRAALTQCLAAINASLVRLEPDTTNSYELIVVADGAVEACEDLVAAHSGRVIVVKDRSGPAVARNVGAAEARGDILVFVDADVVMAGDVLERMAAFFRDRPDASAVFGAYDEHPADPGFISQYKNLAHSYIHQSSAGQAQSFWAGLGAVRRDPFANVGGFDERFVRPSVEDIDLGYRLTAAGYAVWLDPSLTGCHLKRWTLASMIASDIRDRGIPWTQLILRERAWPGTLNVRNQYKWSAALTSLAVALAMLGAIDWRLAAPAPPFALAAVWMSRGYYRFFYERRGLPFALATVPLHMLQHLYNAASFVTGAAIVLISTRRTSAGSPPDRRFATARASAAPAPSPAADPRPRSAAAAPPA